jgi:FixJ family two-component response regulator
MPKPLVIIIEDDDSMRAALVSLVGSYEFTVSEYPSADDFLGSKEVDDASCIISDIQMPGMDGFDLIAALATRASRIPIILITARLEKVLERQALENGAFCFLRKPFDAELLISQISQALAGRD